MKRTVSMGRPRLDEDDESVSAHVCVPSRQYDELCSEARHEGISVAEVIRRALRAHTKKSES
jgi:hypothetical protein